MDHDMRFGDYQATTPRCAGGLVGAQISGSALYAL